MKPPGLRNDEIARLPWDVLDSPGTVLIDDWDICLNSGVSYIFSSPIDSIFCDTLDNIPNAIRAIADHQSNGRYVAGYFAYDSGLQLDKHIQSRHTPEVPYICAFVYETAVILDRSAAGFADWGNSNAITVPRLNIPESDYLESIDRIKTYISAGDVYQVNYTCKLLFENNNTPSSLFARIREAHPVCHSAFINAGQFSVMSLSPELFLRKTGNKLIAKPMKGTAPRGRWCAEDSIRADALHDDPKNRAENVMILDLMRNDIGRLCEYGSVVASNLFKVERYQSLLQMTSQTEGTLRNKVTLTDIFEATFPAGSITGTPKSRALEIIDELESESRGVYCGSIGLFQPYGDFVLNVAIRTIVQRGKHCELGVGSGIVADSEPAHELQETLLKSRFLKAEPRTFRLLETLLFDPRNGFSYLQAHLERMQASAIYFNYEFDIEAAERALENVASNIPNSTDGICRVRLLSSIDGEFTTQCAKIEPSPDVTVRLALSSQNIDPDNIFLYHKTTNRNAYDEELSVARSKGCFDVLHLNMRNEITECCVTNICVKLDGKWFTPPIECGLLPGLWRQEMIRTMCMTERVVTLSDLADAEAVMIGNSVRGSIEIESIETVDGTVIYSIKS